MLKRIPVLQHIANHLGAAIASKFVPLASIFIYSRYMTVYDYGVVNLFTSYLWIFAITMSLNLHTGIGRYIYNEDGEFDRFLGASLLAMSFTYLTTASLVLYNLGEVSSVLGLPPQVVILILMVVLGQIAESLFSQVTIFQQRSALLLKVVSAKAIASFLISIGLLLTLESEKYLTVLYADALASFALTAYVFGSLRASVRWSFRVDHFRQMCAYSLPLIPYMLSLTLLSQFDRVLIDRYFGKESTGLYSLAYNIGILLLMVVTAVLNTFNPAFFSALNKKDYTRVITDSRNIFALAVVVTGILVLFGQDLAALVAPAQYSSAFDIIPTVALGGLCFTIFHIWVRVIAYTNRTALISMIAITATVANVSLNYWLLPIAGYKIAAVTTAAAYLVMSLGCVAVLNYVVRIFRVNVLPEIMYVGAMGSLTLFCYIFPSQSFSSMAFKVALLLILVWHLKDNLLGIVQSRSRN